MKQPMRSARRRSAARKIQVGRAGFAHALGVHVATLSTAGCGGRAAEAPVAGKPAYAAEEATLFNDLFRPELFGLDAIEPAPENDRLLPDRVARADVIVAARVVTVTRESDGRGGTYRVVVEPVARPLVGPPTDAPLALTVREKSHAYAFIDANRNACVGIRTLLFARSYDDGLHFHASVDTPAVREAVIRARIEQSGRP